MSPDSDFSVLGVLGVWFYLLAVILNFYNLWRIFYDIWYNKHGGEELSMWANCDILKRHDWDTHAWARSCKRCEVAEMRMTTTSRWEPIWDVDKRLSPEEYD